jgi:hypothetical protein
MTDVAAIGGAFQSLRAAFEIGKALLDLNISAQVRERISDMNVKIIAAQESSVASYEHQSFLTKRINDLEKQIADFEAWNTEAEAYELSDLRRKGDPRGSIFAYAPKEGTEQAKIPHFLCAECFQNRHRSPLQNQELVGRLPVLLCLHCKSIIYLQGERPDPGSPMKPRRG